MGNIVPSVTGAEHVGPQQTGDNVEAKRVVNYVWNGSSWERQAPSTAVDYDKIFSYTATTDIIAYELDAVVIKTKTVTYTDATKAVVDSVVWS